MSLDPVKYGGIAVDFRPGTLLRHTETGYTQPNFEDVVLLKKRTGKTSSEIGRLAGVDGRVVRRWMASPDKQSSNIPYSAWRLLLIECNLLGTNS